jgi:hypothetical protein
MNNIYYDDNPKVEEQFKLDITTITPLSVGIESMVEKHYKLETNG